MNDKNCILFCMMKSYRYMVENHVFSVFSSLPEAKGLREVKFLYNREKAVNIN